MAKLRFALGGAFPKLGDAKLHKILIDILK
jgi:hypothetical protein